jgi:RNA polymerase sigma factor (sigma-70 family)
MSSAAPSDRIDHSTPPEVAEEPHLRVIAGGEEPASNAFPEPTTERTEPDAVLLNQFISSKDREAFAAIVRRYERLVMGVALRQVGDRHRAEDVFQATFLVLAEQAERIRRPESLASWLHGTTRRIGLSALKDSRRHSAMSHVTSEPTTDPDGQVLVEMQRAFEQQTFDEELANLPDSLRLPLVLHYLEGLTAHEVAQRLGLSTDTVEGRLKKGRKELRQRLVRHGIGFGVVLAAFQMSQQLAAASTGSLVEATVASSVAWVTHQPLEACTANAACLAGKELAAMTAAKTTTLLTGMSILCVTTGLLGAFALADGNGPGRGRSAGTPDFSTEIGSAGDGTGAAGSFVAAGPPANPVLFNGEDVVIRRQGDQIIIVGENPQALDRIETMLLGDVEALKDLDLLNPQRSPHDPLSTLGVTGAMAGDLMGLTDSMGGRAGMAGLPGTMVPPGQGPRSYSQLSPSRQTIERALDASTLPNLAGAILREFVELLGENLGIPIRIDEAALDESGVPTDIDVDVPQGLANRETLSFVLDPLDLDYIIKNGVLTVTTREAADNFRETVVYELRHLHPAIPANDTTAVTDLMMNSTSGPWLDTDGDGGTISELPGGLAVRQSQRVHREIVALLEQLEQFASRKDLPVVPPTINSDGSSGGFGGGGLGDGGEGGFGGGGFGGGGGGTN